MSFNSPTGNHSGSNLEEPNPLTYLSYPFNAVLEWTPQAPMGDPPFPSHFDVGIHQPNVSHVSLHFLRSGIMCPHCNQEVTHSCTTSSTQSAASVSASSSTSQLAYGYPHPIHRHFQTPSIGLSAPASTASPFASQLPYGYPHCDSQTTSSITQPAPTAVTSVFNNAAVDRGIIQCPTTPDPITIHAPSVLSIQKQSGNQPGHLASKKRERETEVQGGPLRKMARQNSPIFSHREAGGSLQLFTDSSGPIPSLASRSALSGPSRTDFGSPPVQSTIRPAKKIGGYDIWDFNRRVRVEYNRRIKRVVDARLTRVLEHETAAISLRFSRDGRFLAVGCWANGKTYIHDMKQNGKSRVLRDLVSGKSATVIDVCFSPNGKYLATGSTDHYIRVWNITKKSPHIRNAFNDGVFIGSLNFSPDGRLLLACCTGYGTVLWNMKDGSARRFFHSDSEGVVAWTAKFRPDGQYFAAGRSNGEVSIFHVRAGRLVESSKVHDQDINCTAFTPDGQSLLSGGDDNMLKRWDVSFLDAAESEAGRDDEIEREKIHDFSDHGDSVNCIGISPNGKWVFSSTNRRGTIHVWNAHNGELQCKIQGEDPLAHLELSPAGDCFASIFIKKWPVCLWTLKEI